MKYFTRITKIAPLVALLSLTYAHAQDATLRLVEINEIKVTGTRLPASSIIRLSGLKLHDKVNDLTVNKACHLITATGLIKSVDYFYDAYPDRPGVVLNLTLVDEAPILPAIVKPSSQESAMWSALQALDPLFTRELPPTEKALAFYSKNFDRCLHTVGQPDSYMASNVTADSTGKLNAIIFEIRQYKGSPAR